MCEAIVDVLKPCANSPPPQIAKDFETGREFGEFRNLY